jgi:nicotinate-nucleotide--dimethylbenzimidazole phosphoribosyltransferase
MEHKPLNLNSREDVKRSIQEHLDNLTKPKGSLGKLEDYCIKMALIQHRVPPVINKKGIYIFAGDHGIVQEGVSLYPSEVTYQMVLNFLSGGAGINALAAGTEWELAAVDAGVSAQFPGDDELPPRGRGRLIRKKVGPGTRNFLQEPAMTADELSRAMAAGEELAEEAAELGYDITAVGDMGIGNTTTAAAVLSASGFPTEKVVDRGTGIDDDALKLKLQVVKTAVAARGPFDGPETVLQGVGGYDLAMMTGFILGLKGKKIACVIDGFPVTAAAYLAWSIDREVSDYLFAGHKSKVSGHGPVLDAIGLDPILNLNMRLGEGTGAVLGGFLVEMAVKTAGEMASFADAEVSGSTTEEQAY